MQKVDTENLIGGQGLIVWEGIIELRLLKNLPVQSSNKKLVFVEADNRRIEEDIFWRTDG